MRARLCVCVCVCVCLYACVRLASSLPPVLTHAPGPVMSMHDTRIQHARHVTHHARMLPMLGAGSFVDVKGSSNCCCDEPPSPLQGAPAP
jgi:hypothetical protein